MKRFTLGGIVALLLLLFPAPGACETPAWSVLFYFATDEEDLGRHTEPQINRFLESPFPAEVEIAVGYDPYLASGARRGITQDGKIIFQTPLPEADSASPAAFAAFLDWAGRSTSGQRKMLVIVSHSWGWKGIIQDYTVPGNPGGNTMLPMREFARIIRESGLAPEVLFLDCCICGNAEVLEELRGVAPFLAVSQKDTPYCGFPYREFMCFLAEENPSPREAAAFIPPRYAAAFTRDGKHTADEGGCDLVTAVAIDMKTWEGFSARFKKLVQVLAECGFRDLLKKDPTLFSEIVDADGNMDLVEFLSRLPRVIPRESVSRLARQLLEEIGYPLDRASRLNSPLRLTPAEARSLCLTIQADPLPDRELASETLIKQWNETNQDLALPEGLSLKILEGTRRGRLERFLEIRGTVPRSFSFRPWLPGARHVVLTTRSPTGSIRRATFRRPEDMFSAKGFPAGSFLVSEAHTQGSPFVHGIGLMFRPRMDRTEERAHDPLSGLSGPDLYKSTAWNRNTGWGDLILLDEDPGNLE